MPGRACRIRGGQDPALRSTRGAQRGNSGRRSRATRFGGRDKGALVVDGGASILDRQMRELAQVADDVTDDRRHPPGAAIGMPVSSPTCPRLRTARRLARGARRGRARLVSWSPATCRTSPRRSLAHLLVADRRRRHRRAADRTRLSSAVRRLHARLPRPIARRLAERRLRMTRMLSEMRVARA